MIPEHPDAVPVSSEERGESREDKSTWMVTTAGDRGSVSKEDRSDIGLLAYAACDLREDWPSAVAGWGDVRLTAADLY